MKKNYRKGIMQIATIEDEVTRYKLECMDEIAVVPYFEGDSGTSDTISSGANDGVAEDKNDK